MSGTIDGEDYDLFAAYAPPDAAVAPADSYDTLSASVGYRDYLSTETVYGGIPAFYTPPQFIASPPQYLVAAQANTAVLDRMVGGNGDGSTLGVYVTLVDESLLGIGTGEFIGTAASIGQPMQFINHDTVQFVNSGATFVIPTTPVVIPQAGEMNLMQPEATADDWLNVIETIAGLGAAPLVSTALFYSYVVNLPAAMGLTMMIAGVASANAINLGIGGSLSRIGHDLVAAATINEQAQANGWHIGSPGL